MKLASTLTVTLLVMACVGSAFASSNPSTWDHNDPSYTYQSWDFATATNPAHPEDYVNIYGQPSASITGGVWQSGNWTVIGSDTMGLTANVPGKEDPLLHRLVSVRLSYGTIGTTWPELVSFGIVPSDQEAQVRWVTGGTSVSIPIGGTGFAGITKWAVWEVWPESSSETISAQWNPGGGTVFLYGMTVETISVPEPTGLLLLSCALAASTFRRNGFLSRKAANRIP